MKGDELMMKIHRLFHRLFHRHSSYYHRNKFISSQLHQNPNKIGIFQTYQQKNEYEKITTLPTTKCL